MGRRIRSSHKYEDDCHCSTVSRFTAGTLKVDVSRFPVFWQENRRQNGVGLSL